MKVRTHLNVNGRRSLVVEAGEWLHISVDFRELFLLVLATFLASGLVIGALQWDEVLKFLERCLPW
jgi:hypothetical protein